MKSCSELLVFRQRGSYLIMMIHDAFKELGELVNNKFKLHSSHSYFPLVLSCLFFQERESSEMIP